MHLSLRAKAACFVLLATACSAPEQAGSTTASANGSASGSSAQRARPETVRAEKRSIAKSRSYVGSIVAQLDAVLSSPVGGRVESFDFDRGDAVTRGALLMRLRAEDLSFATRAAEANAAQAEARLGGARSAEQVPEVVAARANLEMAQDAVRRAQALFEHGSTSEQDLLRARTNAESAEAQYRSAIAGAQGSLSMVAQTRAAASQQRVLLSDKTIRAPFDGVIFDRFVQIGQQAQPGEALLRIVDPQSLRVRFEVPQAEADEAAIGRSIVFTHRGAEMAGTIVRVTPGLVGNAHLRVVEANIAAPQNSESMTQLLAGSRISLQLLLSSQEDSVVVPLRATRSTAGVVRAWVVKDNRLSERLLEVLRIESENVLVRSGVLEGEEIVLAPQGDFRDGEELGTAPAAPASGVAR